MIDRLAASRESVRVQGRWRWVVGGLGLIAFPFAGASLWILAGTGPQPGFAAMGGSLSQPALERPVAARWVADFSPPTPLELPNWTDLAHQPGELAPAPWAAPPSLREGAGTAPPAVSALSAVVVDEASAAILFSKDAFKQSPPASLTKIVTAILTIESLEQTQQVTVDVDATTMRGSSVMGLRPGETYSVNELLLGLMLPSGNDAALALGRAAAGNDAAFVGRMNEFALRLGLKDTAFANPHGLNARGHYSSAYDLALLARYAMTNAQFRTLVTTRSAVVGAKKISLTNGNSFLKAYAGGDGVKIGFTRQAGNTLIASATRNGHRLYAVVLNAMPDAAQRDADAAALLDWAFASYAW